MRKKLYVLCMAAALVLSACGSEAEETKVTPALAGEEETVETEVQEEVAVETAEVETEVVETESETETAPESEAETETDATEAKVPEFTKGIITENGWESEWLGMRYVMSDGMVMSTEEELAAAMGLSQEMLSEDFSEVQLKYAEMVTVQEMMCTAPDLATNVNLSVENVQLSISVDAFIELFKNTISELDMSAMKMTFVGETEDVIIAGKEFKKLKCEVDYDGVVVLQDYYIAMQDTRAISIVNTYVDETTAEIMMSGFQPY